MQTRTQEGHCSSLSESGISMDRRRAAALFGKSKQSPKEPISCRGSRIENRSTAELERRIGDKSGEVALVHQPLIHRLAGRPVFPHNSRRSHQDGLANWCRPTGFDRFGGTSALRAMIIYIYIYIGRECVQYTRSSRSNFILRAVSYLGCHECSYDGDILLETRYATGFGFRSTR